MIISKLVPVMFMPDSQHDCVKGINHGMQLEVAYVNEVNCF